ncbi:MAG: phosphoglycerate mutase family protein [Acidimicrobiales bacterium]
MALFVIRHASAGARNPAAPDDHLRALDAAGHERAATIAAHLADRRVQRVLTSPAVRCRQTVEPLAAMVGAEVEEHQALAEGTALVDALALVAGLAKEGPTAALCTHGDLIPEIIRTLQRTGTTVNGRTGWAKGSIWTLEVRDGEIASASYESFSGAGLLS